MRHKKKFINKKNATTFKILTKEQQEKLGLKLVEDDETKKKRIEEQIKYGVYYEDDYNYMQHLRERNPTSVMVPVSELRETATTRPYSARDDYVDGEEGIDDMIILDMLNGEKWEPSASKNPKPEFWDEDIESALMNPSSDPEDLEDDFFLKANEGQKVDPQFEDAEMDDDDEEEEDAESDEMMMDHKPSTLNDLTIEKMLKVFENSEDEEEDSEGSEEEEDAPAPSNPASSLGEQGWLKLDKTTREWDLESNKLTDDLKLSTLRLCQVTEEQQDKLVKRTVVEPVRKSESQPSWPPTPASLSRASNYTNGPKYIDEPDKPARKISLDPRTGIPKAVTLGRLRELEAVKDPRDLATEATPDSLALKLAQELTVRHRGETPEEKKERKAMIKKHNRERRIEKKANSQAFKMDEVKHKKQAHNLAAAGKIIKLR